MVVDRDDNMKPLDGRPLLETINDPADLRRLSRAELKQLADELREFVLHSVSQDRRPPVARTSARSS